MDVIVRVLPTVLLVAYSQVIVKWRAEYLQPVVSGYAEGWQRYLAYLTDPFVLSAYFAGLVGSFFWLYTVSRLPLAQAFPIYQGLTFVCVVAASAFMLNEPMNMPKLLGAALILVGVAIGAQG
ncbi:EamA family transporter [uncultured Ralstonia sp.]|jgi:multidrug transporter EmrE-like cation transporter|uniref:EamA family transporter n=1 Tax=uncultured Ralstonia sp. TaxID=114715 RepID=UPI001EA97EF1|nr:EamA family transporter [uncultured Ralstonia sp.]UCF24235.1 MAG: EamA family transporter [Ralstonia sp.]